MNICIGRQLGSGGRTIAKQLAERLNCKFYDSEILNLAAKESGFSEKFFKQNDENKGFLRTLFHMHVPHISDVSFYKNDFSQESLFQFQSDAIRKAAKEDKCVFVGRCADYILKDREDALHVFVHADEAFKAERIVRLYGESEKKPEERLREKDTKRAVNYKHFTDRNWGDCRNYDLSLNSGKLGIERCVELIVQLANEE